MKQVLKKFFSIAMATLIVISQTPIGVLLGTVPQTNATILGVTVTSPTGGAISGTRNITWTTNPLEDPENVDISYCQGSSCTIENWSLTPIALAEANDGSYSWDTNSVPNGTGYRIVIARAGFQSPLGLSPSFEVYNFDYGPRYTDYTGILNDGPIWTNTEYLLSAYATDQVVRSEYEWSQQSGPGIISFNDVSHLANSSSTNVSANTDGEYTIRFTATDYAGNIAYEDLTFNWDTTGPTADDDVQAGWYNGSAYITFTCDDGTGIGCNRVRYALNGAPTPGSSDSVSIEAGEGSMSISNIGTYTLWYIAEDDLGNLSAAQSGENLLRIEYDYDDPEYRDYVDIYDDEYRRNQFQKSASVDVPTGVLSGAWTMISGPGQILFSDASANPTNIEANTEGEYVIEYEVTTNGGSTYSDSFTLIWDQTEPTSTDNAPAGRQNAPVTVDFDCDDTLGAGDYSDCERMYYNINDGGWNYLDINYEDFDLYFDSDGTYNVEYYAVDRAGNSEEDEVNNSFTLEIDQTDPTVSINMDWMGESDDETLYSTGQSEAIAITTDDNLSGIATCTWTVENAQYGTTGDITFDDGETDGCASMSVTATQPGIYTIRVTVTDNAGNTNYDEFTLYYDDSTPVVENLNVTVESYSTIHVAGLAKNIDGFSPINLVQYWINEEGGYNDFLTLSEENVTETNFYGDIDISGLPNGTYTIHVRAITLSEEMSETITQSFTKTSSPAQIYGPRVVSSTPSNAATYVSVAGGVAQITFDANLQYACWYGECYNVDIKKTSNGDSVVSGGEAGISWTGNILSIEYTELEYNTNYVISIPAYSVIDENNNWNQQETLIYFTTHVGNAPEIEGLWVDNVGHDEATIYADVNRQNRPQTATYRVSTTAYNGTRYDLSPNEGPFYADLSGLSPNTTYYYQVRFTREGRVTESVPMSFKTAAASNGIVVHNIARILNGNTPTAGSGYDYGYHFRFYITLNNLDEDMLEFKLNNWTRVDNQNPMAVANNTKVIVTENGTSDYDNRQAVNLSNTNYHQISSECPSINYMDADNTLGGRQLYLDLFYKIPVGAQGVYGTSFGIRSSVMEITSDGGPQVLDYTTSC